MSLQVSGDLIGAREHSPEPSGAPPVSLSWQCSPACPATTTMAGSPPRVSCLKCVARLVEQEVGQVMH